jgi:hypothetical protein
LARSDGFGARFGTEPRGEVVRRREEAARDVDVNHDHP